MLKKVQASTKGIVTRVSADVNEESPMLEKINAQNEAAVVSGEPCHCIDSYGIRQSMCAQFDGAAGTRFACCTKFVDDNKKSVECLKYMFEMLSARVQVP